MDPLESCVPPGFRFHPTEEELVDYYLKRKISSLKIDLDVIVELDLYKMEPWDIQERCNLGYYEQNEWYFFSHKDKKYPTGTRTNRATVAGFWKATGRDKAVMSKSKLIGMRKTLVFYKGRAPNGRKSDWIMHEYRLQSSEHGPPQEEGWVVCRAFKKPTPNHRQGFEAWNHARDNISRPHQSFSDTTSNPSSASTGLYTDQGSMYHHQVFDSEQSQLTISNNNQSEPFLVMELPQLDSPTMSTMHQSEDCNEDERSNHSGSQYVDWSRTPLIPHQNLDDFGHLETENNVSYLLGCFPD